MQEVFMKTWRYVCDGNKIENMKAFLYRSAHNIIVNEARKKKEISLDKLQSDGFDVANTDDRKMQSSAELSVLNKMMEDLESEDKELLTMRYLDDLKPEEIAEIKKVSPNLVSVRIHRVIKKIRKLEQENE
jgi:RNA polymerase sigma-70 factor (ECF subfamily)